MEGEAASQAQIDAANAYEALFVPAEFQEWAPRMVAAAGIARGHRVLDVACGTGVLAREAARQVGPEGRVAGVDPAPGMIAVAARLSPGIEWRQGPAESLPFDDERFDAVVSQFGLMFFSDRSAGLREMRRVLKPGGRLAVAVWDTLGHTPAYAAVVSMLERIAGAPAANALRAPFSLGDRAELAALFADAGMPDAAIATIAGRAMFPSIRTMVEADLRGWLPLAGINLTDDAIRQLLDEAEHVLRPYTDADGTVRFESPAHIVTAAK